MDGTWTRTEVSFPSGEELLVGDLVLPDGPGPHPVVLSVAGTGPQDRYGNQVLPDGTVDPHPRHRWVGDRLAAAGIAQMCWDKRGVGASTGGDRAAGDPPGDRDAHASVETDVVDLLAAVDFLAAHEWIDRRRIVVMGTSAGAHFTCRAAARTDVPAGYVLWGGVHQEIDEFADYIYALIRSWAARGDAEREALEANKPGALATADRWPAMLEAARRGETTFEWTDEDGEPHIRYLTRTIQELEHAYPEQFANVTQPVMVIHGDRDINVPVQQAHDSAAALRAAGNDDVTLVIVRGADHGMHAVAVDDEEHLRRWMTGGDRGPHSELFIGAVTGWVRDLWARYPA
ncbi:alpha/beta hydrolase family protein [Euzebya rosea]|uniref:alpha/beta hydrolase family protein n=1 Tax=Euzebya rosea TaxID=2052804 RepID=UPI000D3E4A14|nr:prolyl oligopeptidase family serine peptidase [Euzebya rosea]